MCQWLNLHSYLLCASQISVNGFAPICSPFGGKLCASGYKSVHLGAFLCTKQGAHPKLLLIFCS